MRVSIIIPVYNEKDTIQKCLDSLEKQTLKDKEIIVVDDGSADGSEKFASLSQSHKGPGAARNLGAKKAKGEILVFVDADMEFASDFIEKLVKPINGKNIGTFSKDEYLLNKDNAIARCWNLNLGRNSDTMDPKDYISTGWRAKIKSKYKKIESGFSEEIRREDSQHVFRAILKSEFEKSGGFDEQVGYTDDWSIARKLGKMASVAPGAVFYHRNPETLKEIWEQARWFGKNEFLTGNLIRKLFNLVRYNPVTGFLIGIYGSVKFRESQFFIFKIVYDTAVFTSVLLSFFGEKKYK